MSNTTETPGTGRRTLQLGDLWRISGNDPICHHFYEKYAHVTGETDNSFKIGSVEPGSSKPRSFKVSKHVPVPDHWELVSQMESADNNIVRPDGCGCSLGRHCPAIGLPVVK